MLVQRQEKTDVPHQASRLRAKKSFLLLFVLFRPSTDWIYVSLHWEVKSTLLSQMLISSGNILIDTPRNNV